MPESAGDKAKAIRERIRGNFDRGAGVYARFEAETGFFRRLLGELLGMGPPLEGLRVLDVGCGTGASLALLAEAVGRAGGAVGVDVSLGMLREARSRLDAGSSLVQMDGCRLADGLRGPFEAIVYNAVLFMLPDARASLEGASLLLGPGGVVLASHLEGARLLPRGISLPDALAEKGLSPGRHAVSPWPAVARALGEVFAPPKVRQLELRLSAGDFLAFYGQEPMSAGLLPGLGYPQRLAAIEGLSGSWAEGGEWVEQTWNLAVARKPVDAGPSSAASSEGSRS